MDSLILSLMLSLTPCEKESMRFYQACLETEFKACPPYDENSKHLHVPSCMDVAMTVCRQRRDTKRKTCEEKHE